MITTVNPGRLLVLEGSFELVLPAQLPTVVDRESGGFVTLFDLLRSFLEDPDERVTGPVRITIEPA